MKISARIIAPIVLAFFCAGALIVFLWWQLSQSAAILNKPTTSETGSVIPDGISVIDDSSLTTGDVALIHLRQGDLLSLRGEWTEAEVEYKASADAGGGLPALRKLAQAQLQRRDMDALEDTITDLKNAGARPEDLLLLESIVKLRTGELVAAGDVLNAAADSPQKHYGLALLALVQGDHAKTQQELTFVVNGWDPVLRSYAKTLQGAYEEFSLFPESTNEHLITLLSRALAEVQECELAIPLLLQVTQKSDDYRDAWIVQGYCELTTERPEQALASLEHAYNLDPQKPEIQYFLARAYGKMHEYQNAITFLEYAITNGFEPQVEVRRLIAQYALEVGNAGLALEQYGLLTESEAATFDMFEGYIAASLSLGQPDEAHEKAVLATQRWPEDARTFDLLAETLLRLDRKDEAKVANDQALQLNPNLKTAVQRQKDL